jgi:glutamate synthase domain-containing protein 2/glutamate synthase domain-containing protein 1/glutamate synthase domain-containing protein 3
LALWTILTEVAAMEQSATRSPFSGGRSAAGSLYDARFEHDACGVGFVVRTSGDADHDVVRRGLIALGRLAHRGAVAADGLSGDGAGVLTQIPRRLVEREALQHGWAVGERDLVAIAMLFLPPDDETAADALAAGLERQGLRVLGWRDVPVEAKALGASARASMPGIRQLIALGPEGVDEATLEQRLYVARRRFEREARAGYVCSLSCRTIVYKALCAGGQLPRFYGDLCDPLYESAFTVFHQRYSTNTLPSWELAQPFRLLAHNGEINTLWGNRAWLRARERELPQDLKPVLTEGGSDSASLDEALELLARGGRDLDHALAMLIVPAWEERADLPPSLAAFYRYHAALMEPWDGPAALALSDGRLVCAALDRNGLRPCRYQICRDGLVVAGSEVGLFDLADEEVIEKGRLGPGQMLLVDLVEQRVLHDGELRERVSAREPYEQLLGARRFGAAQLLGDAHPTEQGPPLATRHHLFGVTAEDVKFVLAPMAEEAKEATWSMGDDTPVPPLARSPRSLYTFLRQRFAQVTNPPIDPLREAGVMSLRSWIGPRPTLLTRGPQATSFELDSPVLSLSCAAALRNQSHLTATEVPCTFDPAAESLPAALDRICAHAEAAVLDGAALLILSDRLADHDSAPVPMALAVGAVHQQLVRTALRVRAGLVVEAGDCWDVHHLAVLVGYGAGAVCPWLALHSARETRPEDGEAALVHALELGLRKVLSKMGISAVSSYRAGQFFEVLGLADEIVDRCFTGTPNRIGGIGWEQLQEAIAARHGAAIAAANRSAKLPDYGLLRFRRSEQAEQHAWEPTAVRALQRAVGVGHRSGSEQDAAAWQEFRGIAGGTQARNLRDLLDFVAAGPAVPLEEVEPASSIVRRFVVSAMSLGALSPEAHLTLTIAMNRLGARSNTGEGGEDPAHYLPRPDGDRADCKVKQVASGRFGVTAEYLARADELEIKIAQGSKPGEGGQLPGHKVTELIARLRHAQPGLPLISPPPHHDIYSIEDIAQLIYDLKRCNPRAAVGVKLVAEVGVGTVAAGVAKAHADYVVISGHSGGTGASPLSSIKYAGAPWELGLAEAQQVLMRNGLRGRIRVRTDGGLMTASDVVIAALLGADEFSFGTAPLVALGCDMARQCHLNTCPTGIATQQPELRAKFRGTPEQVVRYFLMLAEDVRQLLAPLGLRSLADATGRSDLLRQVHFTGSLDLAPLLAHVEGDERRNVVERNDRIEEDEPLDEVLLREAATALAAGERFHAARTIRNADRTVGARISGEIALRSGGAPDAGTIDLRFTGSAGQSFGAFCGAGMRLELTGDANDYVGKGLCGAELVLRPTGAAADAPHRNVILGNVALYGATSGRLFAAGTAGERFAVRNSGASAVVEGVGDHGCEYMTGGVVVVLGETGRNFGAGMTGGVAFVYDETGRLPERVNPDSVACRRPGEEDFGVLRTLLEEHIVQTGSVHATQLARGWDGASRRFWRVEPRVAVPATVASTEGADAATAIAGG